MDEFEISVRRVIDDDIRPRVRVDGGDIKFESLEEDMVRVGAYADCAICPCCEREFSRWISGYVYEKTGRKLRVSIVKHVPYYAR